MVGLNSSSLYQRWESLLDLGTFTTAEIFSLMAREVTIMHPSALGALASSATHALSIAAAKKALQADSPALHLAGTVMGLAISTVAMPYLMSRCAVHTVIRLNFETALRTALMSLAVKTAAYGLYWMGSELVDHYLWQPPKKVKDLEPLQSSQLAHMKAFYTSHPEQQKELSLSLQQALSLPLGTCTEVGDEWTKEGLTAIRNESLNFLTPEQSRKLNQFFLENDLLPQSRNYDKNELPDIPKTLESLSPQKLSWVHLNLQLTEAAIPTDLAHQFFDNGFKPARNEWIELSLAGDPSKLQSFELEWLRNSYLACPEKWKELDFETQKAFKKLCPIPLLLYPKTAEEIQDLGNQELKDYHVAFRENPDFKDEFSLELRRVFADRIEELLDFNVDNLFGKDEQRVAENYLIGRVTTKQALAIGLIVMVVIPAFIGIGALYFRSGASDNTSEPIKDNESDSCLGDNCLVVSKGSQAVNRLSPSKIKETDTNPKVISLNLPEGKRDSVIDTPNPFIQNEFCPAKPSGLESPVIDQSQKILEVIPPFLHQPELLLSRNASQPVIQEEDFCPAKPFVSKIADHSIKQAFETKWVDQLEKFDLSESQVIDEGPKVDSSPVSDQSQVAEEVATLFSQQPELSRSGNGTNPEVWNQEISLASNPFLLSSHSNSSWGAKGSSETAKPEFPFNERPLVCSHSSVLPVDQSNPFSLLRKYYPEIINEELKMLRVPTPKVAEQEKSHSFSFNFLAPVGLSLAVLLKAIGVFASNKPNKANDDPNVGSFDEGEGRNKVSLDSLSSSSSSPPIEGSSPNRDEVYEGLDNLFESDDGSSLSSAPSSSPGVISTPKNSSERKERGDSHVSSPKREEGREKELNSPSPSPSSPSKVDSIPNRGIQGPVFRLSMPGSSSLPSELGVNHSSVNNKLSVWSQSKASGQKKQQLAPLNEQSFAGKQVVRLAWDGKLVPFNLEKNREILLNAQYITFDTVQNGMRSELILDLSNPILKSQLDRLLSQPLSKKSQQATEGPPAKVQIKMAVVNDGKANLYQLDASCPQTVKLSQELLRQSRALNSNSDSNSSVAISKVNSANPSQGQASSPPMLGPIRPPVKSEGHSLSNSSLFDRSHERREKDLRDDSGSHVGNRPKRKEKNTDENFEGVAGLFKEADESLLPSQSQVSCSDDGSQFGKLAFFDPVHDKEALIGATNIIFDYQDQTQGFEMHLSFPKQLNAESLAGFAKKQERSKGAQFSGTQIQMIVTRDGKETHYQLDADQGVVSSFINGLSRLADQPKTVQKPHNGEKEREEDSLVKTTTKKYIKKRTLNLLQGKKGKPVNRDFKPEGKKGSNQLSAFFNESDSSSSDANLSSEKKVDEWQIRQDRANRNRFYSEQNKKWWTRSYHAGDSGHPSKMMKYRVVLEEYPRIMEQLLKDPYYAKNISSLDKIYQHSDWLVRKGSPNSKLYQNLNRAIQAALKPIDPNWGPVYGYSDARGQRQTLVQSLRAAIADPEYQAYRLKSEIELSNFEDKEKRFCQAAIRMLSEAIFLPEIHNYLKDVTDLWVGTSRYHKNKEEDREPVTAANFVQKICDRNTDIKEAPKDVLGKSTAALEGQKGSGALGTEDFIGTVLKKSEEKA